MAVTAETGTTRHASRTARRIRRFLTHSWQALVVGAVVLSMGVLALLSPGLVQADVRLDEGTVHVVKQDARKLGVLNAQIDELSNFVAVGDPQMRVLQDEDTTLVHGAESSKLMEYDPIRNRMGKPVQLPSTASVQLGGGTVLVVDPDNGKVWFGPPTTILETNFQEEKAHLEVSEFGAATVTSTGEVIGLDTQRSVLVRAGEGAPLETPLPFRLDAEAQNVDLSSVGDKAVVLDRGSGRIWVEGMSRHFEVSGASTAKLMEPAPNALGGDDGALAIYATQAGLIALTSDGPRSLTGNVDALPYRPVQVGDCVYAAFGEQFEKVCRGGKSESRAIEEIPEGEPDFVFQVNRSTVALNDVVSGVVWMVDKDMLIIDDWDRVGPPEQEDEDERADDETVVQPQRLEENTPPIAQDDTLAARAGRSTILNVLDNDTDPDGDVLTISVRGELPGAALQVVRGGTGLQITIDPDATGPLNFSYTIDDGRGEQDTAEVTVSVLPLDPAESNEAPFKHNRAMPLRLALGETLTKRVLMDWRDPDGDDLFLVDAHVEEGVDDEVSFTPDGDVTFRDVGKAAGPKKVSVTVSDGFLDVTDEMVVEVIDDIVAPIAHGDFETTTVGKTINVYPLANDVGNNLSLMDVDDTDCGCAISRNYQQKRFSFKADRADTYYIPYKVSNGTTTMGVVRIDVREESTNTPPVAAVDVALLPPDGSVLIDPLLNDTDADGDVLVVRKVSESPGLKVSVKRRHLVTIEAQHRLEGPITLTYRVSDGKHLVDGTIIVLPTRDPGSPEPQAQPDAAKIRAGSTHSIDVLANDSSPIGLDLTLGKLVENSLDDDKAWIDGDRLRVAVPAGRRPGDISFTYEIRDSMDRVASSTVTVTVVSEDAENEAPAPRPVVERVLAGTTTRLLIPLDGIDPNGDAVRLVGLGSGPTLGRVMAVGDGWLTYEAFAQSKGTDIFSYQVVDSLGLVGTGEIRVGVAPLGRENSPPTGVADEIEVRPGRHVQIPALRNDVDIDGDAIGYVDTDPVEIEGVQDVEIIENRDISFVAPEEPGVYTGTYWIQDARGGQGSGELQITVSEDAPLLPPEARDDIVPVSALAGLDWVDVDVTANDVDPDGRQDELRVEVKDYGAPPDEAARVTDGRVVTVKVMDEMQQIRYTVIDPDQNSSTGLVLVPGRNDSVPVLSDPDLQLEVMAGQVLPIDINSHVTGTAGRAVKLTSMDNVSVTNGTKEPAGTQRVDYVPDIQYEGPAAVVFEVKDDTPEDDKTAKSAFISIPVQVTPAPKGPESGDDKDLVVANTAPLPRVDGEIVLNVGPDEGDARLDLLPLFEDVDGDEFAFEDFSHASGDKSIEWRTSSDGTTLFASAPITAQPDNSRVLSGKVVDANGGSRTFQVRLAVVSSTRPLATTVTDLKDAHSGKEVAVSVLANDKSNLLNDTSLHLQKDVTIISGSGTARVEGDVVHITPDATFVGDLTVSYTVMDATLDPNRRVGGTIRVTVKDRPGRPGAPRDGVTGNGTVTFTYTPGSPNGYDILSRKAVALTASGGRIESACKSTTCTVTGLPNGQPYRFQVTETNEVGESLPSPESAVYIPDVKPSAPSKPTVTSGDKQLTVTWQEPTWEDPSNPGSKVERYAVELLRENGTRAGLKEDLTGSPTSWTWTGLVNGENYRFRVRAGNRAGDSPFSEMSNVEYPAGPPAAPGSVTATPTKTTLGGAFVVEFAAAGIDNNGDAISEFLVTPVNRSGGDAVAKARTVPFSGAAIQSVTMEDLGEHYYRFKVQAKNRAGLGAAATTPEWQVAWGLPTLSNVTPSTGDGFIKLVSQDNFSDRPQANPVKEYSLNGGGWTRLPQDGRITGLTNGRAYRVELRVKIDGPRYSETKGFSQLMPRSEVPVWPTFAPERFINKGSAGLIVVLDKPSDMEASGGWDPAQYQFWCEAHCVETSWTGSESFTVPASVAGGTGIPVSVRHSGYRDGRTTKRHTISAPSTFSWDRGSRSFSFRLNYVKGATCTLRAAAVADDVGDYSKAFAQGGGTSISGNEVLPVGVTPDVVSLACKTDYFQETFEVESQ